MPSACAPCATGSKPPRYHTTRVALLIACAAPQQSRVLPGLGAMGELLQEGASQKSTVAAVLRCADGNSVQRAKSDSEKKAGGPQTSKGIIWDGEAMKEWGAEVFSLARHAQAGGPIKPAAQPGRLAAGSAPLRLDVHRHCTDTDTVPAPERCIAGAAPQGRIK